MVGVTTLTPGCTRPRGAGSPPAEPVRGWATVPVRRAAPGIHGARTSGRDGRDTDHLAHTAGLAPIPRCGLPHRSTPGTPVGCRHARWELLRAHDRPRPPDR